MNFTREPIIETIITPREGCKLLVRNSKGGGQEEYFVDAIEVVSFGHSFFFRSLERPKSFLVPVSDYEVVEVKETRVALKNVPHERTIKIGGGREAPRPAREQPPERERPLEHVASDEEASEGEPAMPATSEQRSDKKRDRRHRRRRRPGDDRHEQKDWERKPQEQSQTQPPSEAAAEGGGASSDETQVSSSMFSKLFPPPTTLISETISRYKDTSVSEGPILPKKVEEEPPAKKRNKKEEEGESPGTETNSLHRIASPDYQTFPNQNTMIDGNHFIS